MQYQAYKFYSTEEIIIFLLNITCAGDGGWVCVQGKYFLFDIAAHVIKAFLALSSLSTNLFLAWNETFLQGRLSQSPGSYTQKKNSNTNQD